MDVIENQSGGLDYTYKMKKGVSKIQGAIHILQDMKYPEEIVHDVKNYGESMRNESDELASENK